MKGDLFRVYLCFEGEGRYKCVVRAHLNGKYVRKYFAKISEAETWAQIKNIEAINQGGRACGISDRPANGSAGGHQAS